MNRIFIRLLSLALALFWITASTAHAHRQNESYLFFNVTDTSLSGRVEATLPDLGLILDIDDDADGAISQDEVTANADAIFAFFNDTLTITHEGRDLPLVQAPVAFLDTPQGTFAQIGFDIPSLTDTPDSVDVTYVSPFDEASPGHLGFAIIESNTRTGLEGNESYISIVFEPGQNTQPLSLVGEPTGKIFKDFIIHGIMHIWFGFDHVVFLVALLLPAVLLRHENTWLPVDSFRSALWTVVKIATVFTVSHSITLSLSALDIVRLNTSFVEWVIAASIIIVALMNMFPKYHRHSLWLVFAFGIFHGFGFANVLEPLGLLPYSQIVGLAAFNIGVEIGQIAIILVLFPVLFLLRRWSAYPFLALKVGSVALILLAGVWLFERSTGAIYYFQQSLQQSEA